MHTILMKFLREISTSFNLTSYNRKGDFFATWVAFCHAHHSQSDLDAYSFSAVLRACSSLPGCKQGRQVHGLMIKRGSDTGVVTKTVLMDVYSRYGYLDDSVKVFKEMESKDVVTWNRLLSSFLQHGLAQEAFGLFQAMKRDGVEFTEFTLCSVLKLCSALKAFRPGKQVHGQVVVLGRDMMVLSTALIDFYSNYGCISKAINVFYSLNCQKDDAILNSLISGCVKNHKYEDAISIVCSMKPNVIALTSILDACSEDSNLWIGKQIHCLAIRQYFTKSTQMCNALLDMYAKCGEISKACSMFNHICEKDVVSWTSMIDAYGSHGYGLEALNLFKKMVEGRTGIWPNSVTFLAILSACRHSGLVDQGREIFKLMRDKYVLFPNPEQFACFIDILGRAGQIDDAWSLLLDMIKDGTKPTTAVWAALLCASSHNMDVNRGELAAKKLLHLEPNKPGNYVLVSNFYAAIGKWDFVDKLRSIMRMKGLIKEAGNSWLTVSYSNENTIWLSG